MGGEDTNLQRWAFWGMFAFCWLDYKIQYLFWPPKKKIFWEKKKFMRKGKSDFEIRTTFVFLFMRISF
ncbi:MAG: hypothetical protein KDD06_02475 [Phaeodactylibacter sp.]|nr:hypothetical protein [Phaeodactylibacter sp.]MCB9264635.1 hypothetical protein [Lewinellaceae bacterium]MCB9287262.1 hypothetical protein [Lewinellaceae bacterium]